jgi:hypothetical protein
MVCICKQCAFINECEYHKETVEPVLNIVEDAFLYSDEFTEKLKNVLAEFECEYFESEK